MAKPESKFYSLDVNDTTLETVPQGEEWTLYTLETRNAHATDEVGITAYIEKPDGTRWHAVPGTKLPAGDGLNGLAKPKVLTEGYKIGGYTSSASINADLAADIEKRSV